jgi:hypothetical protein
LPDPATRRLCCDVVIQLGACLGIAGRCLCRGTQPRQGAIARWSLGSELGEGGFGLCMLVLLGQLGSLLEGGAGLGGLLGLPVLVSAPATYGGDDQHHQGDEDDRIFVPQLLELFATYFLVDFVK